MFVTSCGIVLSLLFTFVRLLPGCHLSFHFVISCFILKVLSSCVLSGFTFPPFLSFLVPSFPCHVFEMLFCYAAVVFHSIPIFRSLCPPVSWNLSVFFCLFICFVVRLFLSLPDQICWAHHPYGFFRSYKFAVRLQLLCLRCNWAPSSPCALSEHKP